MSWRFVFDDKERVGAWVAERVDQKDSWGSFCAMGIEVDEVLVSGVVINNINGSNATAHIAVDKPTRQLKELLNHVIVYAFGQCGLRRLTGYVAESNEKALKFDRHLGFVEEFVMKEAAPDGRNIVVLVLWPWNWRL